MLGSKSHQKPLLRRGQDRPSAASLSAHHCSRASLSARPNNGPVKGLGGLETWQTSSPNS